MPSWNDSVEERKTKVSRLENIVSEHLSWAKGQDLDQEYFDQEISEMKAYCFQDLRKSFALKN